MLSPFDPYLQLQDRALLVPDEAHRKDLWRVLGRPGNVHDGEIVGTWRPRATAKTFRLTAMAWRRLPVGARCVPSPVRPNDSPPITGLALGDVEWA